MEKSARGSKRAGLAVDRRAGRGALLGQARPGALSRSLARCHGGGQTALAMTHAFPRRALLKAAAGAALSSAFGLPARALAAPVKTAEDEFFLFIHAAGGWDDGWAGAS